VGAKRVRKKDGSTLMVIMHFETKKKAIIIKIE
jgi:hypothetical protein